MSKARIIRLLVLVSVAVGTLLYRSAHRATVSSVDGPPVTGGKLVVSYRAEPRSFNRLVSPRAAEGLLTLLTQATLVRVNRATGELEPRLARDWANSADGMTWTLQLRRDVTFSDGAPFTAADVLFTFQALYDPRVGSQMASSFKVNGQPLTVSASDDHTVVLKFPAPFGPGLTILDALPILPKHKLDAALAAGTFDKAWGVTGPVSDVVGLGPFVLADYVPGQRLRYTRNTHFWRRDDRGETLPYLDEIEVQTVPEQNAEVLRLEAGDTDLMNDQVRAEDLAALKKLEAEGRIKIIEAGVGVDPSLLWFNLAAGAPRAKDKPWLQSEDFRRAVSYTVDRQAIVDTVYLGAAEPIYGPVTAGYAEWFVPTLPKTPRDAAKAKALFASAGLTDRNGDGKLEDAAGKPAQIQLLTQKGHTVRERTAAVLQQQFGQAGIAVDIVPLDGPSLQQQFYGGDYDAIYYGVLTDSRDPARNQDYWMSNGDFHPWNPKQITPATPWETRIDELMRKQSTTLDKAERIRLFAEVQGVWAEHMPALYFAAPKVFVAMSARVHGATPTVLQPPVLWNAEMLSVTAGATPLRK